MAVVLRKEFERGRLVLWKIEESREELQKLVRADDICSAERFTNVQRQIEHLCWRAALRGEGIESEVGYSTIGAPYLVDKEQSKEGGKTGGEIDAKVEKEAEQKLGCEKAEQKLGGEKAGHKLSGEKAEQKLGGEKAGQKLGGGKAEHKLGGEAATLQSGEKKTPKIGVAHTREMVALVISEGRCAVDIESKSRNFDHAASRFISDRERALKESNHPLFEALIWCGKETLYKYSERDELNLIEDLEIVEVDFDVGVAVGKIIPLGIELELGIELCDGQIVTYII